MEECSNLERTSTREEVLEFITANTLDIIILLNEDLTLKYITSSGESILGFPKDKLMDMAIIDLIHIEDRRKFDLFISNINGFTNTPKTQVRFHSAEGIYKYIEIYGKVSNQSERIFEYTLSCRDNTENFKREVSVQDQKRNEEEGKYKRMIQAIPDSVFILKGQTVFFANKAGVKYLGYSRLEEVKNKNIFHFIKVHPSFEKKSNEDINFVRNNGYLPLTEEKVIRGTDNKVLNFEAIVTDNYIEEGNYIVIARDITDRKRAEKLENTMAEKSKLLFEASQYEKLRTDFFANISHELRTPINVILSALQLTSFNIDSNKDFVVTERMFKKYVSIMKQNSYRLVRLIDNLIDVTKIDAGYLQLELSNNDIVNIVKDITKSISQYVENKGISLNFETNVKEKIIACDRDKIERIMLNIISNSLKFTNAGGKIFVKVMDQGEYIAISVKDTGIGISKENQNIIFDRFIQVDKSLARDNEGSGIGLSLVKSLVEMHKGCITVESELNKGSEFLIKLLVYQIVEKNPSGKGFIIDDNSEKINIEFSDIYL